jgi:cytochrome c biogenesis protein CcdA
MLHTSTRAIGRRYPLLGIAGAALLLAAWLGLEAERLRAGQIGAAAGAWPAGVPFTLICNLVSPALAPAGALLIPAALAATAPCLLQMSAVLVAALLAGMAREQQSAGRPALRRAGVWFGTGFMGVYALAVLGVALAGATLASYAFALRAAGGALLLLLGLAVLRVLPGALLSGCRGPRWLIASGRASLRRPLGAGVAFAIYCVGCCGPYLLGLALLGAGAGPGWQGAAISGGFGLAMGGLLLLPILALPASQRLARALQRHARPIAALAGALLVAIGAALVLEPALVWALLS